MSLSSPANNEKYQGISEGLTFDHFRELKAAQAEKVAKVEKAIRYLSTVYQIQNSLCWPFIIFIEDKNIFLTSYLSTIDMAC